MKDAFSAIGVAVIVLGMLMCGGVVLWIANPFMQAADVVNKTVDADNMIYNYEWFKQRHESIDAIDFKIRAQQLSVEDFEKSAGDRKDWHREDREEHARLSTILTGLRQQRADLAAEYNARSRMANRSIFKSGDVELPESIPVDGGK